MSLLRLIPCLLFAVTAAAATPDELEFFEKRIRPVLAERCYACHSAQTMAMAELRLDSRESLRKGGSRGPAVTPGDPASSSLLDAVSYRSLDLKMPPDGKLPDRQIADLRTWIEMGAPDPREDAPAPPAAAFTGIDWDEARTFWSFQPLKEPPPPAVSDAEWPANPIDRFLLAGIEAADLEPAPQADRRSLIRRVTFDLTGLPPTPAEVQAFLADDSPEAWKRLVDRLLASPHYGERWARHWLDLVRYAETSGHEYDNNKPDAWRYRDYVIRAFNQDLPYDQFVREQIAGDLLDEPRLTPDGERLEAPIATGVYWLWEILNSPTDSVKARADQVDNQIDVLSKTFFGLTLACARCHDHKFDPLPTSDYYALAGVLHSTELRERSIDAGKVSADIRERRARLAKIDRTLKELLRDTRRRRLQSDGARLLVARWASAKDYIAGEPGHPLYPLIRLATPSEEPFAERLRAMRAEMRAWAAKADPSHSLWAERGDELYEDFTDGYQGWDIDGAAFGDAPSRTLPANLSIDGRSATPAATSFSGGDEFTGLLSSRGFRVPEKQFLHIRMAGSKGGSGRSDPAKSRVTLFASGWPSKRFAASGTGRMEWVTERLIFERGRLGRLQITDRDRRGHILVDRVVFSDSEQPPPIAEPPDPRVLALLEGSEFGSTQELAEAYAALAVELFSTADRTPEDEALLAAIEGPRAIDEALKRLPAPQHEKAIGLISERSSTLAGLPESRFAMSSQDYDPHDVRLHQRGSHKNLGEEVPRGFLTLFAGEDQPPFRDGSGRLALARWATAPENPLTARVMVNRVWKHHFGRGLVRSPDNFGEMGERPTHPELLNYLAAQFVAGGWSVKDLHRKILHSQAYRMDSRASDAALQLDPDNRLLSHMPVRRLEAEAIRDSLLAVAGTLDLQVGGPPVPPHISEHQDGRGKPKPGPLDGDGRRSIYIGVRRNFLTPLFLAFDYPTPISTRGRRGVSAVPSQALILLNNKLVNLQAERWAQSELRRHDDAEGRLIDMFERAFTRPPTLAEVDKIATFLTAQQSRYGDVGSDDPRIWKDLAHVLINTTEFIFVR